MKRDPLQQYTSLRQQLLAEKASLLERLHALNQALQSCGPPSSPQRPAAAKLAAASDTETPVRSEELLTQRDAIMRALKEQGPMTRQELGNAIQKMGYISQAKDPLNSMGIVLYAKNSPIQKKDGRFFLPAHYKP